MNMEMLNLGRGEARRWLSRFGRLIMSYGQGLESRVQRSLHASPGDERSATTSGRLG